MLGMLMLLLVSYVSKLVSKMLAIRTNANYGRVWQFVNSESSTTFQFPDGQEHIVAAVRQLAAPQWA